MAVAARWAGMAESGSMAAMRTMAWFHETFGRRLSLALLYPITTYFYLRAPETRRASRDYLQALHSSSPSGTGLGRAPTSRDSFRHLHCFAINLLDRMVMWGGDAHGFDMQHRGSEELLRLARAGTGGILLGAHVGSYDMPRVLAETGGVTVNVVMFTKHAARINAFFEQRDARSKIRVLNLDPSTIKAGLEIKACLDRGEFVGILADRITPGGREQAVETMFLGRPAVFPLSPFLLGCVLGRPLLVSLCVRTGDARYETVVETLWEGERVPRARCEPLARTLLERYVRVLEEQCRRAPYEWFNLYDFWDGATSSVEVRAA